MVWGHAQIDPVVFALSKSDHMARELHHTIVLQIVGHTWQRPPAATRVVVCPGM
jgi:hypothetical protein